MKRFGKMLQGILVVGGFALICTGCSVPHYSRTVVRRYDAAGNLTGTEITEHVNQADPNSKPLLDPLKNQDYTK